MIDLIFKIAVGITLLASLFTNYAQRTIYMNQQKIISELIEADSKIIDMLEQLIRERHRHE